MALTDLWTRSREQLMRQAIGTRLLASLCVAVALAACGADGDGRKHFDASVGCYGASAGTPFELPEGAYKGTLKASDTASCGLNVSGSAEQAIEIGVTESSVTLEPGKPAQVSMIRTGNKLCGTSQREYRLTQDGNLCILDEADSTNGEVTAAGELWVDLDFGWTQKGGVCKGLTLPCSGRTTWSFVNEVHSLEAGHYQATVTKVEQNTCNTAKMPYVNLTYFPNVSITSNALSLCVDAKCLNLTRDGNKLSYSGAFDWSNPTCSGTEKIVGAITSTTQFALTRTLETSSSCDLPCLFVYHEAVRKF